MVVVIDLGDAGDSIQEELCVELQGLLVLVSADVGQMLWTGGIFEQGTINSVLPLLTAIALPPAPRYNLQQSFLQA